jgi:hypothetical protein
MNSLFPKLLRQLLIFMESKHEVLSLILGQSVIYHISLNVIDSVYDICMLWSEGCCHV